MEPPYRFIWGGELPSQGGELHVYTCRGGETGPRIPSRPLWGEELLPRAGGGGVKSIVFASPTRLSRAGRFIFEMSSWNLE